MWQERRKKRFKLTNGSKKRNVNQIGLLIITSLWFDATWLTTLISFIRQFYLGALRDLI